MDKYKVKVEFTEKLLGTVPKSKELYQNYILDRAVREGVELTEEQMEQELSTVQGLEEKGWTGFHTLEDGTPALYDYVFKGFFKDACSMLRRVDGTESAKLRAHRKVIDGLVFVYPRLIPLNLHGREMEPLERPLRAQTPQGERITLARSDTCPIGTTAEFTLEVLGGVSRKLLEEWLDYGSKRGLGAWRNASWGRFSYTCLMRGRAV